MKKIVTKIMTMITMLAMSIGCLSNITPVCAASLSDAQFAVCYFHVVVEDANGNIIESANFQSAPVNVTGDVTAALDQAETEIKSSANVWLLQHGNYSSRTAYEAAVENGDGTVTAYRDVTWHATPFETTVTPDTDNSNDKQESSEEQTETIPLSASAPGEYQCGPSAGDYCITINQPVTVNDLIFGVYGLGSANWSSYQSNGKTYVTISRDMVNTVNDIVKDKGYTITLKTNKGNVTVYVMVRGFYDRNDPTGANDWYYNEDKGIWEARYKDPSDSGTSSSGNQQTENSQESSVNTPETSSDAQTGSSSSSDSAHEEEASSENIQVDDSDIEIVEAEEAAEEESPSDNEPTYIITGSEDKQVTIDVAGEEESGISQTELIIIAAACAIAIAGVVTILVKKNDKKQ